MLHAYTRAPKLTNYISRGERTKRGSTRSTPNPPVCKYVRRWVLIGDILRTHYPGYEPQQDASPQVPPLFLFPIQALAKGGEGGAVPLRST